MRPAISASFLLLLLLFATAQGIHLKGELSSAFQRKLQEEKGSIPTGRGAHLCSKGGHCSGKSRKLVTAATAGNKSTRSEGTGHGGSQRLRPKEEVVGFPALPAASGHGSSAPEPNYPDIIDIAGMDYSPARRKPPIHN